MSGEEFVFFIGRPGKNGVITKVMAKTADNLAAIEAASPASPWSDSNHTRAAEASADRVVAVESSSLVTAESTDPSLALRADKASSPRRGGDGRGGKKISPFRLTSPFCRQCLIKFRRML
jgi:hypothetical protein